MKTAPISCSRVVVHPITTRGLFTQKHVLNVCFQKVFQGCVGGLFPSSGAFLTTLRGSFLHHCSCLVVVADQDEGT